METALEALANSGGYAMLCVLLIFQLREINGVVRENTKAVAGLLAYLKGDEKGGGG